MRIIATTALIALFPVFGYGQNEVSISTNPVLEARFEEEQQSLGIRGEKKWRTLEKSVCSEPTEDVISVIAGQTALVPLEFDTIGFGADGSYQCIDCGTQSFGIASLVIEVGGSISYSLSYEANTDATANVETVSVRYCDVTGVECTEAVDFSFLARRRGVHNFPAAIVAQQEEVVNVTAPNDLPGALKCNFFETCPDNYEGRDQLAYFTDYSGPVETFVYRASRFAGVDSLCLVLCDEYGICDTTHYAFRVDVTSKNPPFYDDFSYGEPIPAAGLWLDKEVYVNTEMPISPRSVGVATFDGLSNRGRPYGDGYGEADHLTSTYLNTNSGDWALSFWLQRGGIADRPETQDSLVLQFRNDNNDWVSVREFEGMAANQPFSIKDSFQFYVEPITEAYQHNRFQFRFLNYSDRSGFRDNWHLDYVRLDNNPTGSEVFNDIAFTTKPAFILNNYTSMPWRHFQPQLNEELKSTVDVGVYNHFASAQNASPSMVALQEQLTGISPFGIAPTLFNGLEVNLDNGVPINRSYSLMGDATGFSDVWAPYSGQMGSADFDDLDVLGFRLTYSLQNTSQENFDFVNENDQVSRTTRFSNYFAYDDGTAESALETSNGRQIAVAYTASVADTIQGVRLHFPHTNEDVTDQSFRLRIWIGDLDGSPDYSVVYQPVYASSFFDTLQGFTSYQLLDEEGELAPLPIPAGTFYVGWQQISSCEFGSCIAVGYDRNQPQGKDFIFVENGNGWDPISGVTDGALMLRPVMSGGEPIGTTAVENPEALAELQLFPNPAYDRVALKTNLDQTSGATVLIFNTTGQLVHQQAFATNINIGNLPAGMYFVQLKSADGNQSAPQRLIVAK